MLMPCLFQGFAMFMSGLCQVYVGLFQVFPCLCQVNVGFI